MGISVLSARVAWGGLAASAILAGCASSACPSTESALRDPALGERIGPGFVAGTAVVNRFVDSPDSEYRGYDLTITSRIAGLRPADQIMFASAQDPLPGIELGSEVLIVGRRGPKPLEISASGCPVLAPLGSP